MNQTVFTMINNKPRLLLALFVLLQALSLPAKAAKPVDLYSASVKVSNQSIKERRSASQDALAEVFIRASGKAEVVQNQAIRALLSKPDQFILSYAYQSIARAEPLVTTEESQQQGFVLTLDFDAAQINKSLRAANLPVWGSDRPQILLWWAVEDESGRRLINSDKDDNAAQIVQRHAKRRGIPIAWPLLDLQDTNRLSVADVWGFYSDKVQLASKRYGTQAILLGQTRKNGQGRWFGSWLVLINQQQFKFDAHGKDLEAVMQQAMDFAADKLAEQYAVIKTAAGVDEVILKVSHVDTLADYAELNNYLGGLSAVAQVILKNVDQGTLWYTLKLESDVSNLEKLMRLDKRLRKQSNMDELIVDESILEYQWRAF